MGTRPGVVITTIPLPAKAMVVVVDERLTDVSGFARLQDRRALAHGRVRLILEQEPERDLGEVWAQVCQEMALSLEEVDS